MRSTHAYGEQKDGLLDVSWRLWTLLLSMLISSGWARGEILPISVTFETEDNYFSVN
jgi:hypothetical protein